MGTLAVLALVARFLWGVGDGSRAAAGDALSERRSVEQPASGGTTAQPALAGPGAALAGGPRASAALARDRALEGRLRARIQTSLEQAAYATKRRVGPGTATVAMHVREVGRPGELAALTADRSMRPASNMKLVTSAAALVLLGLDWSFQTRFETAGEVHGGVLEGDLVARAAGDPLFAPGGEPDATRFAPLVDALERAGVRRVRGALVLDEGSFLVPGPGPAWPSDDQFWQEYCALSGGFSANGGCLDALVVSGALGRSARVSVYPRAHGLAQAFDVTTTAARTQLVVRVGARGGKVSVAGSVPTDVQRWTTRFAAPDPVELYGHVLLGALAERGITVERGLVRRRGEPPGAPLATLAAPLAALLEPINTESDNGLADQVFFALADAIVGSGTRAGGRAATAFALAELGVPSEGLVQVDGSGLSRDNRVTARQITALIDAVLAKDVRTAEAFRASLAVAGRSGTLNNRMAHLAQRVHGKTGFIDGTSALSGVIETDSGRWLAFSILVEYPVAAGLNTSVWKPLQDELCGELARWGR